MSETAVDEPLELKEPLPVGSAGARSGGYWGVWTLIATEAMLFGYLLFSYFYTAMQVGRNWPPEGLPKLGVAGANTAILLSSSVFLWIAERLMKKGRRGACLAMLATAILLGAAFVGVQLHEWAGKPYGMTTNLYGSLYFTITGFHMAHVLAGLAVLSFVWLWTALGYFDRGRHAPLSIGGLYWHFVDAVWIFVFSALYLSPYVMRWR
jgi:cytochrome c oxidase subunit 3